MRRAIILHQLVIVQCMQNMIMRIEAFEASWDCICRAQLKSGHKSATCCSLGDFLPPSTKSFLIRECMQAKAAYCALFALSSDSLDSEDFPR